MQKADDKGVRIPFMELLTLFLLLHREEPYVAKIAATGGKM